MNFLADQYFRPLQWLLSVLCEGFSLQPPGQPGWTVRTASHRNPAPGPGAGTWAGWQSLVFCSTVLPGTPGFAAPPSPFWGSFLKWRPCSRNFCAPPAAGPPRLPRAPVPAQSGDLSSSCYSCSSLKSSSVRWCRCGLKDLSK